MHTHTVSHLSDAALVAEVTRLARCEREASVRLIAHLAELDARRLYLTAGFSSLFVYCCEVLCLSEHETYNRIEAARAARRFPVLLERLASGSLNLTTVRLLAPHLTAENLPLLLREAAGRSKRDVEELMARHFPRPETEPSIRKMPAAPVPAPSVVVAQPLVATAALPVPPPCSTPPVLAAPAARPATVSPVAADRYEIRFTASASTRDKLRLAQDLLRHAIPSGDPAEIIDRALTVLLEDLARRKFAATDTPARKSRPTTAGSRHVPAKVKRAVWLRDEGRCAFVSKRGRRCGDRAFLEFHHVEPYGIGGEPTEANIELRCRAHNVYEAQLVFGLSPRMSTRSGTSSAARHHARHVHDPQRRGDGRLL